MGDAPADLGVRRPAGVGAALTSSGSQTHLDPSGVLDERLGVSSGRESFQSTVGLIYAASGRRPGGRNTVTPMFERIVCGVDGSEASLEAVRQADVLATDGGRLVLVAAVDLTDALHFQVAPTAVHAAQPSRITNTVRRASGISAMAPSRRPANCARAALSSGEP